MANPLPARPNLDHLRHQAKTLLAKLKEGDAAAAKAFVAHLPAARGKSQAAVKAAGYKLADAQSVVARQAGFDSWPQLSRHVTELRDLEGEWHFDSLQVDGADVPGAVFARSRVLIDGNRFRMESAEATYDGTITIDTGAEPRRIDIAFVEGPEAGQTAHGIYKLDRDALTICLGLVGSSRPAGFTTRSGSGHALERLHRASAARPAGVTGGTPPAPEAAPPAPTAPPATAGQFDVEMTPLMRRLEGEWVPVAFTRDGQTMPAEWLPFGSRTMTGNEMKIVFGGQTFVHAKIKIDERASPMTIDYFNLSGATKGKVSLGIVECVNDEVRFLTAVPGLPRPAGFETAPGKGLTLTQWRRKGL